MEITANEIRASLSKYKKQIAKTLSVSEDELDILDQNFNYLAKYVHISQHDIQEEYDPTMMLRAVSQVLFFLYMCDEHDIPPASLIGKVVSDTLIFKSENPEMFDAANND